MLLLLLLLLLLLSSWLCWMVGVGGLLLLEIELTSRWRSRVDGVGDGRMGGGRTQHWRCLGRVGGVRRDAVGVGRRRSWRRQQMMRTRIHRQDITGHGGRTGYKGGRGEGKGKKHITLWFMQSVV